MKGYIAVSRQGEVLTRVHPTIEKTIKEYISTLVKDGTLYGHAREYYKEYCVYKYASVEEFMLAEWDWFFEEVLELHRVDIAEEEW